MSAPVLRDRAEDARERITLFLCGDVMPGRGIDQVLPQPSDSRLYEPWVRSATEYVALAEAANGAIPAPVSFDYIWGDALDELERRRPDVRIINLESAVTDSRRPFLKCINYKMSPANFPCVTAAGIDCCVLANNHVMDWERTGLIDTLLTLERAGVASAGAGRDLAQAVAPAVLPIPGKGRVLVFAFGSPTSGVPEDWAATEETPGINLLPHYSDETVRQIVERLAAIKQPGDVVVVSVHWGPNWGYTIPGWQQALAHDLVEEAGVDVVHGHSSHHVKGLEVYKGKLILYGCGDFLNDYEGIHGHEAYRGDLALMYFPSIDSGSGVLERLTMVPMKIEKFRLTRASRADAAWLTDVLNQQGERFNTGAQLSADGTLRLERR